MTRNDKGQITTRGMFSFFRELDSTGKLVVAILMVFLAFGGLPTAAQFVGLTAGQGDSAGWQRGDSLLRIEMRRSDDSLRAGLQVMQSSQQYMLEILRNARISDAVSSGVLTREELAWIRTKRETQRLWQVDVDSLMEVVITRQLLQQERR